MGPLTAERISQILLWPNPTHLEKLSLSNLKTSSYALAIVLSAMKQNRKLICLEIDQIPINNTKNFEYLSQFLKVNRDIKSLKLSWCSFMPKQTVEVVTLIKRRKNLQFLDLSHNAMVSK